MSKIPADAQKRISKEFQKRLLDFMAEEEMTNEEFAAAVGISKTVLLRASIYGIIPSVRILIKLADYLNVSLEYLLGEKEEYAFCKAINPSSFHIRLDELSEMRKVKYSQIAHKMPFSRNFFYEWKRMNTLPSLEYLQALAMYFDVSIDYLLGRTDDM